MRAPLPPGSTACAMLLASASALAAPSSPTTADCLAASDAAIQLDRAHRLREERDQLLACSAASCPADVRKDCMGLVVQVSARIPSVVFAAKDASGADLVAVQVAMDGSVLAERLDGTAIAVDPGEHVFTFTTAGRPPVERRLVVREGERERPRVVSFAMGAVGVPVARGTPPPSPLHGQRLAALVVGGAGVLALGIGTAFAVVAVGDKNDANTLCPGNTCPTEAGVQTWGDAARAGNVSTALFIGGGVALAGAAVLWLVAPNASAAGSTRIGFGPAGLRVEGVF